MSAPSGPVAFDRSTLPPVRVGDRLRALQASLDGAGVEALVVTHLTNVRYLSGFTGSAGTLVVTPNAASLVTDARYGAQAPEQVAQVGGEIEVTIEGAGQLKLLGQMVSSFARVGLEADHCTWSGMRRFADAWSPELVPTQGLVEALRIVKDPAELARMRMAAAIADAALASVRHRLDEAPTEREFADELDAEMRRLGAESTSFETIVASGPNGAKPHARPSSRRIQPGDLVVLDFGCVVDRYCSDMTRTIGVGELTATQTRILEVVEAANAAGVAAIADGVPAKAVDAAARQVIVDAGWGDAFIHGTGHGVGLDIHEAPRVAGESTATLLAGHIITVEPGIYVPEHGGVRIEDTLLVTADGAEPLTHSPKITTVALAS